VCILIYRKQVKPDEQKYIRVVNTVMAIPFNDIEKISENSDEHKKRVKTCEILVSKPFTVDDKALLHILFRSACCGYFVAENIPGSKQVVLKAFSACTIVDCKEFIEEWEKVTGLSPDEIPPRVKRLLKNNILQDFYKILSEIISPGETVEIFEMGTWKKDFPFSQVLITKGEIFSFSLKEEYSRVVHILKNNMMYQKQFAENSNKFERDPEGAIARC